MFVKNNLEYGQQLSRKWYVAFTKLRNEGAAQFHLATKGIEVFYPKLLLVGAGKVGRQIIPLFPNYIFVRIDVSSPEYYSVLWCRGVKKLVSTGEAPSVVEDHIVEFLRAQADSDGLIKATSNLKAGDDVQIVKGPFRGLAGIIQEPPDHKSRVKVLMAILSRHVQVEVPTNCISVGWVAPRPSL